MVLMIVPKFHLYTLRNYAEPPWPFPNVTHVVLNQVEGLKVKGILVITITF